LAVLRTIYRLSYESPRRGRPRVWLIIHFSLCNWRQSHFFLKSTRQTSPNGASPCLTCATYFSISNHTRGVPHLEHATMTQTCLYYVGLNEMKTFHGFRNEVTKPTVSLKATKTHGFWDQKTQIVFSWACQEPPVSTLVT
jgi:hypothetical protein